MAYINGLWTGDDPNHLRPSWDDLPSILQTLNHFKGHPKSFLLLFSWPKLCCFNAWGGFHQKKKNTLDNTQALPRGLPSHQNTYVFWPREPCVPLTFPLQLGWTVWALWDVSKTTPSPQTKEKDVTEKKSGKRTPWQKLDHSFPWFLSTSATQTPARGGPLAFCTVTCVPLASSKKRWSCWSRVATSEAPGLSGWWVELLVMVKPIAQIHSRKASFVLEGTDVSKEQTWTKGLNPPTNHWMIYYIKHIVQQKCVQSSVPL